MSNASNAAIAVSSRVIGSRSAISWVTGIRIVTDLPRFSVAIRLRNAQNCTGIERSSPRS